MPFVLAVIGTFVAGPLIALAMNCLALRLWNKTQDAHWTERARKLYPIRRSASLNIWLLYWLGFAAACVFFPDDSSQWVFYLVMAAMWVGAFLATYPITRAVFPQFSFFSWLRHSVSWGILKFGTIGLVIFAGVLMPSEFGWQMVVLACAVLGIQLGLLYGLWLWIGSKLGLFKRAQDSERVAEIARQTSERMHVPYRSIWKMRSPMGYAAAMPWTRDLIFSEGLLTAHPDEEVAAICAHELAHLTETRGTLRARGFVSLSLFPLIFLRPVVNLFGPLSAVLLWLPIPLAAIFIRRLGRKMEVRADSVASENQETEGVYARALERLYRNNQMPAVMPGKRQLHPHLYDRLLAAGVLPDYPRPKAPSLFSWTSVLLVLVLILFLMAIFFAQQILHEPSPSYNF